MAPPMFSKRLEGWQDKDSPNYNPELVAKHEKSLEEVGKLYRPLPVERDIRHLPEHERKLIEKDDEIKKLQTKILDLSRELDEAYAMLELASTKYMRVKIDVKKLRGTLDFVNGSEFIYASINQNTNVLENVDIKA